jgi:hypothetical protein
LALMATSIIRQLIQMGKAGCELPKVGQQYLVIRGDKTKDMGQEAVVTNRSTACIHISFRD